MRRGLGAFALRLAVALGGLTLVVQLAMPSGESGLLPLLRSAWVASATEGWSWFAVAAGLFGASYAVGALRFKDLLGSAGMGLHYPTLLRAYIIASFFNLVLPGLIMGDVYRLADARRDVGSGARVLGIVVLERLLGFAALGSMALLAAPMLPGETPLTIRAGVALLGAGVTLGPFILLTGRGQALARSLGQYLRRLSDRASKTALEAVAAIEQAGAQRAIIARTFGLSLANQWLPVLAVVALARPLDTDVAFHWYAVIIPFVTLASLLPISIGGAGVREALFVALFGAVGMRPEVAFVLSLSTLAVALAWGSIGLLLFLSGRHQQPAAT